MRIATLSILSVLTVLALPALAGDWPGFGGPDRSGISTETGLVDGFGDGGPKELWAAPMNEGFGGPAVFDGKVYVMDRKGNSATEGSDILVCLDLATGKEQWRESYDAPGKVEYAGARATPAVDKDVIVTVGPLGDVRCWDRTKHTVLWKHDLLGDWNDGRKRGLPGWAVAQSALIDGDLVILAPQNNKVGVVAYDKKTGDIKWQSKPVGKMAYASPLKTKIDDVEQIVMHSGDATVGLDIKTGDILWKFEGWRCNIPIATPTDLGDGRFFVTGAYKAGCAMFQVKKDGRKWTVTEVFNDQGAAKVKPNVHSWIHNAIYYQKHLYANSTANRRGLVCLTPDGDVKWESAQQKVMFDIGGPLLIADGKIFIMDGNSGTLYLLKATPDGYKELGKASVLKGNQIWSCMALSDGKLIVRDKTTLKCLDVKAAK